MIELLNLVLKTYLNSKKYEWQTVKLKNFNRKLSKFQPARLYTGLDAIYISPVLLSENNQKYYWLCLDVEHPSSHDDIAANVEVSADFFESISKRGLHENLTISLTGSGFRFFWPYLIGPDYKRGFFAWLNHPDFSFIDAKCLKSGMPYRIAGYRGHKRQGIPKDIHIHFLESPSEILTLSETKYRDLISGKAPAPYYLDCLKRKILPAEFIPPVFIDYLKTFEYEAKCADSAVRILFPKAPGSTLSDFSQVKTCLLSLGIHATDRERNGINFIKLSRCPECDRKDGNPFITLTGRLKCFHANTCRAGEISDDGKIKGLHPSQWVNNYQDPVPQQKNTATSSVAKARRSIRKAVMNDRDTLITCDPGTGKTTTAIVQLIPYAANRRILYVAPSYRITNEVFSLAQQNAASVGVNVHLLEGRSDTNCHRFSRVQKIAARGYSPIFIYCNSCSFKLDKNCKYLNQFGCLDDFGLFLSVHANLNFLQNRYQKSDGSKISFEIIVIDENSVESIISKSSFTLDQLVRFKAKLPRPGVVIDKIQKIAEQKLRLLDKNPDNRNLYDRLYGTPAPVGSSWEHAPNLFDQARITPKEFNEFHADLLAFKKHKQQIAIDHRVEVSIKNPQTQINWQGPGFTSIATARVAQTKTQILEKLESTASWQRRLYKQKIDLRVLRWLWAIVGESKGTAYLSVDPNSKKRPFNFVRVIKKIPSIKGRLIILDGTGDKSEAVGLFNRDFDHIDARVELETCLKIHLKESLGKVKATHLEPRKLEKLLKRCFSYLDTHKDKKVLIATFKAIEDKVGELAKKLMPFQQVATTHFWASRGINEYRDFDAVICFGVPKLHPEKSLDIGMALFSSSKQVSEWIWSRGTKDLVQTIHRIRPVFGNKTIIILGREWPTAEIGAPGLFVNLQKGEDVVFDIAYKRLAKFLSVFRFVTRESAALCGLSFSGNAQFSQYIQAGIANFRPANPHQTGVLSLLKEIYLIDKVRVKRGGSIELPTTQSWRNLLEKLAKCYPEHPPLKVKLKFHGDNWTHGLGAIKPLRRFYEIMGANFLRESVEGQKFDNLPRNRNTPYGKIFLSHFAISLMIPLFVSRNSLMQRACNLLQSTTKQPVFFRAIGHHY